MNASPFQRALILFLTIVPEFVAISAPSHAQDLNEHIEFFERNVRPLLAEKCFSCHGRGQRKGMLALDTREDLMSGGESGAAVFANKPEESLLIEAIEYSGSIQMPPDSKLTDREIAILKQWVANGIQWPAEQQSSPSTMRTDGRISDEDKQFWSFRPIRKPPLPEVKGMEWVRQALDAFVLQRLESEGLEPVLEADRRTYIRRAYFDLIGLPPSEAEISDFVSDVRADAYEVLIDRLLASPQYGERWSRHWLDIARYGEDQAHTFQARSYPSGFRYRDWIIHSLNRDLPIDDFLVRQIAGDLLPGDDRQEHLPALGYFSLGPVYYADAGCAPKAKADEYDDRIDTLTRGMLGLTVSCARCHDHKFDPITMHDYYALAGIFASTDYVEEPLVPSEQVTAYDNAQAAIKGAEQELKDAEASLARQLGESFVPHTADYMLAVLDVLTRRRTDPTYKLSTSVDGTELHEVVLERWLQFLNSDNAKGLPTLKAWYACVEGKVGNERRASGCDDPMAIRSAALELQTKLLDAVKTRQESDAAYREQQAIVKNAATDKVNSDAAKKVIKQELPADVASLLANFIDNANAPFALPQDKQNKLLSEESRQKLGDKKQAIDAMKKAAPAKYPVAHSLKEGKLGNQKIHLRGNVNDLGEETPRRFLEVLSPSVPRNFQQGSGRLDLAEAIANPENPLTARVFVNRIWQHHFGRGIVATPSNFGLLGVPPTHPELLDYLAASFIESGWSLKQLHRQIMLSATYRLDSRGHFKNNEADPENRLLWRMNRRRLDIESWRDAILVVTGNLESFIGGPSFNLGDRNVRRRTVYAAVSRHELNPVLRLFDFPDPNLTSERRSMTTVPMQQLFVLNSDFMVDQSRALASRISKEKVTQLDAQVGQLYRWLFGRVPTDHELSVGVAFLQRVTPESVDASQVKLSRLEQYAQALLSTNEFFFVD
jgi:cytochrome c553